MFIANWKMNGSIPLVKNWLKVINKKLEPEIQSQCIFCPPACFLPIASEMVKTSGLKISLGAQDIDMNIKSSLTGGISGPMLSELGAEYVIIGHSERRDNFKEGNSILLEKVKSASSTNLKIIFCIGETLKEKEKGLTHKILDKQLEIIKDNPMHNIMIAYEPVWAIGSGQNAKISYIKEIHEFISSKIKLMQKDFLGIAYGGSVNSSSAKEIFSLNEVEGLLIGGASLEPLEFSSIAINA